MSGNWRKPVLAILLLAACVAAYCLWFRQVSPEQLRGYIQAQGAAGPVLYILAFTFLPLVFVPAQLLAPAGGLMFGLGPGFLYTMAGALLNSGLMFMLARFLLGDSIGRWLQEKCPEKWRDALFSAQGGSGFWLILVLRLIPAVPYNVINFGAGLTKITFCRYLAATAVGIIPGALVYLNIGDKALDVSSPAFLLALGLLVALTIASLLLAKVVKSGGQPRAWPLLAEQWLMFRPHLAAISPAAEVFWPGCTLLSLDSAVVDGLYEQLKKTLPDLGFSTCCCAKPSQHLAEPRQFQQRVERLNLLLSQAGVRRIYTACPNCTLTLREQCQAEVVSVWPLLAAEFPSAFRGRLAGQSFALHDPCPLRQDEATQQGVREILALAGAEIREFPRHGPQTRCCGNHHMLMQRDPRQGRAMLAQRLAEAPPYPIVSYCQACVGTFRQGGATAFYLPELLWGPSGGQPWRNRWRNLRKFHQKEGK